MVISFVLLRADSRLISPGSPKKDRRRRFLSADLWMSKVRYSLLVDIQRPPAKRAGFEMSNTTTSVDTSARGTPEGRAICKGELDGSGKFPQTDEEHEEGRPPASEERGFLPAVPPGNKAPVRTGSLKTRQSDAQAVNGH